VQLRELGERWGLPAPALDQLETLLRLIADDRSAPTSVRDPERALEIHIADSLSGLEVPELRAAEAIADIGSGAGLPGLVLAAALPGTRFDLIEASRQKAQFIERAAAACELENARAVPARVEEWAIAEGREGYEAVAARAVSALPTLVEYAAPLLRRQGVLVAWKGKRDVEEERAGMEAASVLGMAPKEVRRVRPFPDARDRHLHVYQQVTPCPPGYPRRPGRATKRPLGHRPSRANA
jgi:16S rRNA (guanine527-N7)-methyltransferase